MHVDAFRLGSLAEVDDLDLDASLDEAVTVVEWGKGLVEELTGDRLEVTLERSATAPVGADPDEMADVDEIRTVSVSATGERWRAWTSPRSSRRPEPRATGATARHR